MAKYYSLIERADINSKWCVEFGDYDRLTVLEELKFKCYYGTKRKNVRIIATNEDQQSIDAAMAQIN